MAESASIHITLQRTDSGFVALTNMAPPTRGAPLSPEESAALGMLNQARASGLHVVYGFNPIANLVRDLLNPEALGYAATAEIRDRARQAQGMEPVETVRGAR